MSVYARYKKSAEGFRQLVELLESAPPSRRQKMIDVGMAEDRAYTEKAMSLMLSFEDVMKLPPLELAEVLAECPPRIIGTAIMECPQEVKDTFLKNSKTTVAAEIKDVLEFQKPTKFDINSARLKMIEATRKLEKKGLISTKRIP